MWRIHDLQQHPFLALRIQSRQNGLLLSFALGGENIGNETAALANAAEPMNFLLLTGS